METNKEDKIIRIEPDEPMSLPTKVNPDMVIDKAVIIANKLKDIVLKAHLTQRISQKEYVKVEGWTAMLAMLGITPHVMSCVRIDREDEILYESVVNLITLDGKKVGSGEAICSSKERNWNNRDEFAIKSMSQTRATGKAARLAFSWIMAMAGYEPTPAEEMVDDDGHRVVETIKRDFRTRNVTEHVDTQTGEFIEPPPPVHVEGTKLEQFDPKTETIGFGKNKGMTWLEVPIDYVEWLIKNATKKDIKAKADATFKYRQNLEMQKIDQKSWADETFGEPEPKPEQPSEKKIQELQDSLNEASRTGDPEVIKRWASINKTLLGFLPDELKKSFRDAYNVALNRAKNGGAK